MSLKVIELNDNALRVGDESGILVESPGFALAGNKQLQLGEIAKQQARLQPTNSYNKYLHELSLDPISHAVGIRHAADIAYAHLLHLAEEGGVDADMIFAVPGNFTHQQLALIRCQGERLEKVVFATVGLARGGRPCKQALPLRPETTALGADRHQRGHAVDVPLALPACLSWRGVAKD